KTSNIEHPTSNIERFPCGRRGIFDALDRPSTSNRLPFLTELHLHGHGAAHHSTTPSLHHSITPSLHHSITPPLHPSLMRPTRILASAIIALITLAGARADEQQFLSNVRQL